MRALQIIIPFLIAGIGTCFAGIILDHVQYWDVFIEIDQLFLCLPALLGLKGNLQMTLASRFSTHSHLGHIQTKEDLLSLTCANLSLNQCLAIVISLSASILSVVIHLITTEVPFNLQDLLLISATALLTSSVTSFILDLLMIFVVQVSSYYNINPDNVATPIAASLGDMTALILCSFVAKLFYEIRGTPSFYWLSAITIVFYLFLIPFWASIAQENVHTTRILEQASHWYPLITAMLISSISGVVLNIAISRNREIALFNPIICGVGGNLVAVQASRLSTYLHRTERLGSIPEDEKVCSNPLRLFTSPKPTFVIARILMGIVMPGQLIFYFFSIFLNSSQTTSPSTLFLFLYLIGSEMQVMILLYLAHTLTLALWSQGIDPDNCTIPYLTSISDVLGACIITVICLVCQPNSIPSRRLSHSL